jgi:hypothetical protein
VARLKLPAQAGTIGTGHDSYQILVILAAKQDSGHRSGRPPSSIDGPVPKRPRGKRTAKPVGCQAGDSRVWKGTR